MTLNIAIVGGGLGGLAEPLRRVAVQPETAWEFHCWQDGRVRGWHPMSGRAFETKRWALVDRTLLPRWTTGRASQVQQISRGRETCSQLPGGPEQIEREAAFAQADPLRQSAWPYSHEVRADAAAG